MEVNYRVWKQYPLSLETHWPEPKSWRDEEGKSWPCWPIGSEAQMSWEVRCRDCGKWAHWVGVGFPFADGKQYFVGSDSYCYWCRPRTTFSDEELRIVSREDWAGITVTWFGYTMRVTRKKLLQKYDQKSQE
jgi:hypothetical protein